MSENTQDPGRPDRAGRARRFGWWSLSGWATFGLVLEAMHGFKVAEYLDDALTRELLTLAHAHGIGLAIIMLVWGEAGAPLFAGRSDGAAGAALRLGALAMPLGFALGAIGHPEGDPSPAIALVPVGALAVVYALLRTSHEAQRRAATRGE